MALTREALDDLRAKYEEMLRLRVAHASPDEPDPRRAMAALASRFPGALREIDELTLDDIRARIGAIDRAALEPTSVATWMTAQASFHALMRGALSAKRWLAGKKTIDRATRDAFAREARTLAFGDDATAWIDDLAAIAAPPCGRVTDLVVDRVAQRLGVPTREARVLVFGRSGSRRAARSGGR